MPWFPNKPPVNSSADDFSFKRWFQDVWRFIRGENRANLTLTTATNLSEDFLYPVDATSGAITVTLPLAAKYQYKKFCVKKIDSSANAVTVARSGSDTIDGATTTTLTSQYDAVVVLSNGVTTWHKINSTGGSTSVTFTGAVWLTMVGGGGGGAVATAAGTPGGGGGSGESVESLLIKVTPGAGYSYSVGTGGASATDGGDTYVGVYYCRGGKQGVAAARTGGAGGGRGGGAGAGAGATGSLGSPESAAYFGGAGGGGGGGGTGSNGGPGGGSGGYSFGGLGGVAGGGNGGGGGGGATIYGVGGAGGAGGANGSSAPSTNYGAGGGGGGGAAGSGGSGAGGYILLTWIGGAQVYTSGSGTWTAPS